MRANFLENVRVIDLSQYIPGPFATRQLADLGAEVIKIEPPRGDPMRFFMHGNDNELSPIYRHINRGKRICKLNLKSTAGKQALRELIVDADILGETIKKRGEETQQGKHEGRRQPRQTITHVQVIPADQNHDSDGSGNAN